MRGHYPAPRLPLEPGRLRVSARLYLPSPELGYEGTR